MRLMLDTDAKILTWSRWAQLVQPPRRNLYWPSLLTGSPDQHWLLYHLPAFGLTLPTNHFSYQSRLFHSHCNSYSCRPSCITVLLVFKKLLFDPFQLPNLWHSRVSQSASPILIQHGFQPTGCRMSELMADMVTRADLPHMCPICTQRFKSSTLLRRHLTTHSTAPQLNVPCRNCDRKFKTKYLLYLHIKRHHTKPQKKQPSDYVTNTEPEDKFECDKCEMWFPSHNQLTVHWKQDHPFGVGPASEVVIAEGSVYLEEGSEPCLLNLQIKPEMQQQFLQIVEKPAISWVKQTSYITKNQTLLGPFC